MKMMKAIITCRMIVGLVSCYEMTVYFKYLKKRKSLLGPPSSSSTCDEAQYGAPVFLLPVAKYEIPAIPCTTS